MSMMMALMFAALLQSPTVKVFITAHKSADGFVESGRVSDSLKDLRESVAKLKGVALVEDQRDSQVILELMQAGNVIVAPKQETKVRAGIFGGIDSTTKTTQETLPSMTVLMKVRGSDYEKEFSMTDQRFWKDLAKNIARQFDDWLKVNRANLK